MFSIRHESLPKASSGHNAPLDDSKSQPDPPDTVDAEGESCDIQEVFKDWTLTRRSTHREMLGFMDLLIDLNIELDVVKMLKSLISHLPGGISNYTYVDGILVLKEVLRGLDQAPMRFLLSLGASDRMFNMLQQELKLLYSAQSRRLLFVCLEANINRMDVAKLLLTQHKLDLQSTAPEENLPVIEELASRKDVDPEIVSLLHRYGGYRDLSSREAQDRVIAALSHKLYVTENEKAGYPDEMRGYVDSSSKLQMTRDTMSLRPL